MWFTLADVLVSKILTGRTPKILQAIRFTPKQKQEGLLPVTVSERRIDPNKDDFYRSLIEHRLTLEDRKAGASKAVADRLEADRKAIKILANATSYGIFVELNIKEYVRPQKMLGHGIRGRTQHLRSAKLEQPGRYFHPLLGTLITGAARLMLALAERQVVDQGLDWAFCDTDSMAIANVSKLKLSDFRKRANAVQDWFVDLNPYGRNESILQLEKVNFPKSGPTSVGAIDPPHCLAISSKRYVLYNAGNDGSPIVRKASGHGLGHLLPPYDEPQEKRRDRIKAIGVPLWEENLWKDIVRASHEDDPDIIKYSRIKTLREPAASRYAANNINLHDWFKKLNEGRPYREQVKPFNFLLSLYAKSRVEMEGVDPAALRLPAWHKRHPRPAAPFYSKVKDALPFVFDRDFSERTHIPEEWLESYKRNLAPYHLHPERKFWGPTKEPRGVLRRRHVEALGFEQIGKEADNIDEREVLGDDGDDLVEYEVARQDQVKLRNFVLSAQKEHDLSDRSLLAASHVSAHTFAAVKSGKRVRPSVLMRLAKALDKERQKRLSKSTEAETALFLLRQLRQSLGSDGEVAKLLGKSRSYVTRLLEGKRRITPALEAWLRLESHVKHPGITPTRRLK